MKLIFNILIIVLLVGLVGCSEKHWDDHYNTPPETINSSVWEAIKGKSEFSKFVAYVEKYKLDTLFLGNDVYTLFIPDNTAIDQALSIDTIGLRDISYLISKHFVVATDIQGKRKIQTLHFKFATFENLGGKSSFDGVPFKFESPLYLNGKYFVMDKMVLPRPNLYQYFATNVPALKTYIDSKDSIIIDPKSMPIGFDDSGKTIYDTIAIKYNTFELGVTNLAGYIIKPGWFEVSKEFRAKTATFVYPKLEKYQNALTEMAQKLGGNYRDYNDIPIAWQNDVLIPFLLKHGTFLNMLEASEIRDTNFVAYQKKRQKYTMKNIQNDSIVVSYKAVDPYLCSNGIAYDYNKFSVPDSLYSGTTKFQGEWLAVRSGAGIYKWREGVTINPTPFVPVISLFKGLSNDSVLSVTFTKGYTGAYNLRFKTRNLFPGRYRMVITTNMDLGGIYDIVVNGEVVRTFDYYDYVKNRGIINSVETGRRFSPTGRYNRFDCYVNNITEYGKANIGIVYKGPASGPLVGANIPGLSIDLIEFVPVKN